MGRNQMRRIHAKWLADALAGSRDAEGEEWSQSSLARAAKVSRETIWKILNQKTDAEDDTLAALAGALGLAPPRIGVAPNATPTAYLPGSPQAPRTGHTAVSESTPQPEAQRVEAGTVPAPEPGHPPENEVMLLATRALGHAVRFVLGPEDFNNPGMCRQLALELEAFGDRLKERLGLVEAAADLYKAALILRRAVGDKVKMVIVATLVSITIACGGDTSDPVPPAPRLSVAIGLNLTPRFGSAGFGGCDATWTLTSNEPSTPIAFTIAGGAMPNSGTLQGTSSGVLQLVTGGVYGSPHETTWSFSAPGQSCSTSRRIRQVSSQSPYCWVESPVTQCF